MPVSISEKEYEELKTFKKLVENNLTEDVAEEEMKLIEEARKEKSMSKSEFLRKTKELL